MKETRKQKWSAKRVIFTVLLIFLMVILLVAAAALIYINHMLNKINKVNPELDYTISSSAADDLVYNDPDLITKDPNATETYIKIEDITFPPMTLLPTVPVPPTETTWPIQTTLPTPPVTGTLPPVTVPTEPTPTLPTTVPTQPAPTEPPSPLDDIFGDHLVNILLIGQDRAPGEGRQRSDSMILVSINKSNNTITLTSFMRDQYVQIPGYKPNKLNNAFAYGGMNLLKKTLELNFGVKIDGMVEVDFSGFENIIDLLGGVDVTLTKKEAKYLNDLHEAGLLDSPVTEGPFHLNAKQALVYVGVREIDTDYHRAGRQREVIMGLIEAYKDLPFDQMLALMDEILPLITTDLSNARILGYAVEFFPMLSSAKVQTLRIPVDGTFVGGLVEVRENFYGWFQYNIDFEANKKVLYEIFRRRD